MAGSITEILSVGGRVRLRVEGDSMSPWLRDGVDEVILMHPDERRWGWGDIVLARGESGRFVLHRVVRRANRAVWLRGDAQRAVEGPWADGQVMAVVDEVVRAGGPVAMTSFRARLFAWVWRCRQSIPDAPRRRLREGRWVWSRTRGFRGGLLALAGGGALLSLFGVAFAGITRVLVDRASGAALGGLMVPLAWMAGLVLVQVAAQAVFGIYAARLAVRLETRLRADLFSRLQAVCWKDLQQHHSGDLLTRMTSDVAAVTGGVTGVIPDLLAQLVRFSAALAYLAFLDPVLVLVALAAGPLFLFPGRLFAGRLRKLNQEARANEGRVRGFIQESLRRHAVVKAFGLEAWFGARLDGLQDETLALSRRQAWVSTIPGAGLSLGYWAGYLTALTAGVLRMRAGQATFGTLTAFLQLVGQVQGPFQGMARAAPRLIAMLASAERIMEAEGLPREKDGGDAPVSTALAQGVDLEFNRVAFGYEGTRILDGATFTIRAGETAVLMGGSGEGKTTLLRLLLGLVRPDGGEVLIRERAPGGRTHVASGATRGFFAYVPQGNSLFSGTVAENIRNGGLGAPEDALAAAARLACAEEFIRDLPGGYGALIGEGGDGLSEGQAQRLALARALLRDAPVLVLDEATSALDLPTERLVLDHLRALRPARTILLVSHRPEAQAGCDRIFRVINGRIEEEGFQKESIG
jgi:ABC-type multidrug transport system fused ATPase/permease subunit